MLEDKCRQLEDVISAKDKKIIAFNDRILSYTSHSDVIIESEIYSSNYKKDL